MRGYLSPTEDAEECVMNNNEIVLFESHDGAVTLPVPVRDETVWLTRMQMADLFGVTPQNFTIHLMYVYSVVE